MNTLRRFSRRAWLLHGYLIVSMILWPVPHGNSYWTDSDQDGVKEWVNDPAVGGAWWDLDSDGDFLTNAEELQFGSDPYSKDSDRDGLSDLVERDYTPPALPFDPWNWDSDDDGHSDFDEYYHLIQGYIPVVNYLNLPSGAAWAAGTFFSFSDADGDGTTNPNDSDPLNMDNDSDGILNWEDSWPDDASNGGGAWTEPATMTDSDGDGIDDSSDPFPYGSYWYLGIEYGGTPSDRDSDGIPDEVDSFPDGSYWYNGFEYAGAGSDQDGDGIPDDFDSWPSIAGSYSYGGIEYPGTWNDQDGDGIPDPADGTSEGSYSYDGIEYIGAWVDQDEDGIPDPFDPFPATAGSYTYDGVEYPGVWLDSDSDGTPDALDATPNGGYLYNGVAYSGSWIDTDSDGVPDPADPMPNGSYWWNNVEYEGLWYDQDNDGIPDAFDAIPAGGYWYGDTEYAGTWIDSDGDTIPDPADLTPNGSYWYNGVEYAGTWSDADSDNIPDAADGWPNDSWNGQPHFSYNGSEYAGDWSDRDEDSVPDAADSWPDDPENGADDDNDGLSNYAERTQHFTDPNDVDSDDDYLTDYEELMVFHTNPLAPRTNLAAGQTLLDGQLYLGQLLMGGDTDGDGLPDLLEDFYVALAYDLDKNNSADGLGDLDGDGISNREAFQRGWSLVANRSVSDFDGDRIDDAVEDYWAAVYPGSLDKTIFADAVGDFDQDGLMNHEEVIRHQIGSQLVALNPGDRHSIVNALGLSAAAGPTTTDGQIMTWWWDVNRPDYGGFDDEMEPPVAIAASAELKDGADQNLVNGMPDGYERWLLEVGSNPPRAVAADEDGDGIPNLWEYRYQFNLRDASDAGPALGLAQVSVPLPVEPDPSDPVFYIDSGAGPSFDTDAYNTAMAAYYVQQGLHASALQELARIDPDGDQLSNRREFTLGTDPRVADTDNDGFNDDVEVSAGTDPTSDQSVPLPALQITSGNGQTIISSQMSGLPLEVRLSLVGVPIPGAPVYFDVLEGSGIFQDADGQPLDASMPFTTDAEGKARVFVMAAGVGGTLLIRASSPSASQPVAFTANVQMPPGGGGGGGSTGPGPGPGPGTNPPSAGAAAWMQVRHTSGSYTGTDAGPISYRDYTGALNQAGSGYTWTFTDSDGGTQVENHQGSVQYDGGGAETTSSEGETRTKTQDLKSYQSARAIEEVILHSLQVITGSEPGPSQADLEAEALAKNPVPQTITYSLVSMPPATGWNGESAQIRLVRAPGSDVSQPVSVTFLKLTDVQYSPADTDPSAPYHPSLIGESKTLTIAANAATSINTVVGMAQHGGSRSGSTTVRLLPVEVHVVNRDDPTKKWTDAQMSHGLVYAGTESGDMVSWKINGIDSGTFTWKATSLTGQVINGPAGSGKSEWKIADGDSDPASDWLKWKPGKYTLNCAVQPTGGSLFEIEFDQEVGWRTESWMVIGQIVQTHTHDGDAPAVIEDNGGLDISSPVVSFRRAVVHDIAGWIPIGPVADQVREAVAVTPLPITGKLSEAWFGYWAMVMPHTLTPTGPFTGSSPLGIGNVTEPHRLWMTQHLFNISYDRPSMPATISEAALDGILQDQQYRILHRYQAKFQVETSGAIKVGSMQALSPLGDQGRTKINIGVEAGEFNPVWDNPAWVYNLTSDEPELSPNSNKDGKVSGDAHAISSYWSARVGAHGRNANWRLMGMDAPWIFSEMIFEMKSDGTVDTRLRTSVDIAWKDGSVTSGTKQFNNLNIYKRMVTPLQREVKYERQGLLEMEGKLEPFVKSASGAWPEPPLSPEIQ